MPDTQIEFVDRYSALGIPRPNPATVCHGGCVGTGVIPVSIEHLGGLPGALEVAWQDYRRRQKRLQRHRPAVWCPETQDDRLIAYAGEWLRLHARCGNPFHTVMDWLPQMFGRRRTWRDRQSAFLNLCHDLRWGCDGYHFCVCRECGGTGTRPAAGGAQ